VAGLGGGLQVIDFELARTGNANGHELGLLSAYMKTVQSLILLSYHFPREIKFIEFGDVRILAVPTGESNEWITATSCEIYS